MKFAAVRNVPIAPRLACSDFGKFLASGFFDEGMASEKRENHRIHTGDSWWAWVDLNHRPRPYQDSVVRSYKNLQVPRGLPKTAQVLQDHSNCGLDCGLKISASAGQLDHLRPATHCPYMAFGLALTSSPTAGQAERRGLVPAIILPPRGCYHSATVGAREI
jgi:hypothetical protein